MKTLRSERTCAVRRKERRASLVRLAGAVLGQHLQPRDQYDIDDLIVAVRLVHEHLASCRCQGDEVFVFDLDATAIGDMDQKRAKRLRVQQLANFFNFHLGHDTCGRRIGKLTTASVVRHAKRIRKPCRILYYASVAGQNVAQPPGGNLMNPDVTFSQPGDIAVTVQGQDVSIGFAVNRDGPATT